MGRPQQINDWVYRPFNANRMHAYAIRGRESMRRIYAFLSNETLWDSRHHVDHFLGKFQKTGEAEVYAPRVWLVAQSDGDSDIASMTLGFRNFIGAEDLVHPQVRCPMVAVVGPYSGGTSAAAGALHHLGISMGRTFETPDKTNYRGHFEAAGLAQTCRLLFAEPWLTETSDRETRLALLRIWAANHTSLFMKECRLVGGKHPTFCLMGHELVEAWDTPYIISVERSIEEITNSLVRRNWGWPLEACMLITEQLVASREAFLQTTHAPVLRLAYAELLNAPADSLAQVCAFLDYEPTPEAFAAAVASIGR